MESIFRLNQVLSATDIRLSARCESDARELLAFVTGCGKLTLCYNEGRDSKTIVKILPWLQDSSKRITALAFDPSCAWLLAAGRDGSLFVVPALALVAPTLVLDCRWSTTDITLVADARTNGTAVDVAWWHCQVECQHVAVLAMSSGDVVLASLTERSRVAAINIGRTVSSMRICQDPYLDAAFILLSDSIGQQWRLLLEQRSTGYVWQLDNVNNNDKNNDSASLNTLGAPTARSRLHGLKQLSVEKLASLRQRLAETRGRGGKDSPELHSRTPEPSRRGSTGSSSDDCKDWTVVRPTAEQLGSDTVLMPQHYRHRTVLTALYKTKNIVTIHPMKTEPGLPLSAHKLATEACDELLLLTDNFLFVTDIARQKLVVVSTAFSECRLDGDCEQNPEAVLDQLEFLGDEKILGVFRLSACAVADQAADRSKSKDDQTKSDRGRRSRSRGKDEGRPAKEFSLPTCVSDIQLELKPVDTCVIVTTTGVYKLKLRRGSVELFMELVLERGELEMAERLALLLRLDLQQLLELAGDLELSKSRFQQATALYRLSRCRHLKSVLKLAAVGNSAALLRYVEDLLATVGSTELSASERIHLANLAVMAHADLLLRADQKPAATLRFIGFLSTNQCYDQVLAVNVAGQTRLWKILHYLSSQRGLYPELLDVLTRVLAALLEAGGTEQHAPALDADLWLSASDLRLLPPMLSKPRQCSQHLANIRACLPSLPRSTLLRLADMLDPTSDNFRPTLRRMFKTEAHEERASSNVGRDVILAFALVLAQLCDPPDFDASLMHLHDDVRHDEQDKKQDVEQDKQEARPRCGLVGAGFAHAALVRNAGLYTWGSVQQGCLGTGPTVSRFQSAQPVQALTGARVEVLAVSCGRQHTLALTNNGVYAWGSNQFGQLGIGRSSRSSWPISVSALSDENIVQVSAGQYHSLALTLDGRVFAWGWSVHGQLGTGSIDDVFTPALVPLPMVCAISAGHAHSLALTNDGAVYSFGSAMFGQLGTGSLVKQTRPVLVAGMVEPVVHIATGYFHNLALTSGGLLYTWGLSPQSLRLQVQAHKKQRLLHKHAANQIEAETATTNQSQGESSTANQSGAEAATAANLNLEEYTLSIEGDEKTTEVVITNENDEEIRDNRPKNDLLMAETRSKKAESVEMLTACTTIVLNDEKMQDVGSRSKSEKSMPEETSTKNGRESCYEVCRPLVAERPAKLSPESPGKAKKSLARSLHDLFTDSKDTIVRSTSREKSTPREKEDKKTAKKEKEDTKMEKKEKEHTKMEKKEKDDRKKAAKEKEDTKTEKKEKEDTKTEKKEKENTKMEKKEEMLSEKASEDCVADVEKKDADRDDASGQAVKTSESAKTDAEEIAVKPAGQSCDRKMEPPAYLLEDSSHGHVSPSLVDTSLVVGSITQVAAGGHHSALVTDAGNLYTWGRNLEGQLGCGGRREVAKPTRLTTLDAFGDQATVREVACGSEFTVALTSSRAARVLAWGCNSSAQLGKAPTEDGKALDGKIVMIKTVKRVIKLPHGSNNAVDLPREVTGLGNVSITFRSAAQASGSRILRAVKRDVASLHYLLCRLHGRYDSASLSSALLELRHYQLAATLAAVDHHLDVALHCHLLAVEATINSRLPPGPRGDKTETNPSISVETEPREDTSVLRDALDKEPEVHALSFAEILNQNVALENTAQDMDESSRCETSLVATTSCDVASTSRDDALVMGSGEQESRMVQFAPDCIQVPEKLRPEEEKPGSLTGVNTSDVNVSDELTSVASCSAHEESDTTNPSSEDAKRSDVQEDTEMHQFSVQGGTEEMSEGGSTVTTPSDSLSAPPISPDDSPGHVTTTHRDSSHTYVEELQVLEHAIKDEPIASDVGLEVSVLEETEHKTVEQGPTGLGTVPKADEFEVTELRIRETSCKANDIVPYDGDFDQTEQKILDGPKVADNHHDIHEFQQQCDQNIEGPYAVDNESKVSEFDITKQIVMEVKESEQAEHIRIDEGPKNLDTVSKVKELKVTEHEIKETGPGIHGIVFYDNKLEQTENQTRVTELTVVDVGRDVHEFKQMSEENVIEGPNVVESISKVVEFEVAKKNVMVDSSKVDECEPTEQERADELDTRLVAMATLAAQVVEHHLSLVDERTEPQLSAMLTEAMDFWRRLQLPVEPLESVFERHAEVYYSLGAIIFRDCEADGPGSMLGRFSSKFCLQVCSHLASHIEQGKPHPEFLDLVRSGLVPGANGCTLATALPVPSLKPSH